MKQVSLSKCGFEPDVRTPVFAGVNADLCVTCTLQEANHLVYTLRTPNDESTPQKMIPSERTSLAEFDLQVLDRLLPTTNRYVHFQPVAIAPMEPAQTIEELLGMAYVAVGSSLGGKVIVRHLQSVLRMEVGVGMSFFSGEARGELGWPDWLRALNVRVVGTKVLTPTEN
jgi:hypothetical protein